MVKNANNALENQQKLGYGRARFMTGDADRILRNPVAVTANL